MQWFDESWLRNAYDALKAMFDVEPHVKTAMIQFLFDEGFWDKESLTWDAAVARYDANKNPNKTAKWSPGELLALAIRFNRPQFFIMANDELGLETRQKATEERRQDLQQRHVKALERFNREQGGYGAAMARLDAPEDPKRPIPLTVRRPQFQMLDGEGEAPLPRNLP